MLTVVQQCRNKVAWIPSEARSSSFGFFGATFFSFNVQNSDFVRGKKFSFETRLVGLPVWLGSSSCAEWVIPLKVGSRVSMWSYFRAFLEQLIGCSAGFSNDFWKWVTLQTIKSGISHSRNVSFAARCPTQTIGTWQIESYFLTLIVITVGIRGSLTVVALQRQETACWRNLRKREFAPLNGSDNWKVESSDPPNTSVSTMYSAEY